VCTQRFPHRSCQRVGVEVAVRAGYWDGNDGGVAISISWPDPSDDFDLYVLSAAGAPLASSTQRDTTTESVFIRHPIGRLDVRVAATSVTDSAYTGSVALLQPDPVPPQIGGDPKSLYFAYGTDRSAWFWSIQVEQQITDSNGQLQTLKLPDLEGPSALPVAMVGASATKASALFFNLASRGVVTGSTVSRFVLTLSESGRTTSATGVAMQACRITSAWVSGRAQTWSAVPPYDPAACVSGVPATSGGSRVRRFDLTTDAQAWATAPSSNNGVLFVGSGGSSSRDAAPSWEVDLQIPRGDDPATSANEYARSQDRLTADLAFTAPPTPTPSPTPSPTPTPTPSPSPTPTATSTPSPLPGQLSGDTLTGQRPPAEGNSTFPPLFGSSGSTPPPPTDPGPGQSPNSSGGRAVPLLHRIPLPLTPWYIWLLLPVGLIAVMGAGPLVLTPVRARRPNGASVTASVSPARSDSASRPEAEDGTSG